MRGIEDPGAVFDDLAARGEVVLHASDVERSATLAAHASQGRYVVADTREHVSTINALAHPVLMERGEVCDGVVTAAGERIGVGDVVVTRRNCAVEDVANREVWRVARGCPAAMGLRLRTKSSKSRPSPRSREGRRRRRAMWPVCPHAVSVELTTVRGAAADPGPRRTPSPSQGIGF